MKYVKTKYITKCIIIYMTLPIASKIRMLKHCVPASPIVNDRIFPHAVTRR